MKCRAAKVRMLTDETPQRAPAEVRRHVQRCPRCHRRYRRLVRLIHQVQQLPLPDTSAAQAQFLQRLPPPPVAASFQPADSTRPATLPLRPRRRRYVLRWVQAAVVLIGFGVTWLVLSSKLADKPAGKPAPPAAPSGPVASPEGTLEDRLLEQHLRLAESQEPAEKFQALSKMASDLRGESLREARQGKENDLSLLVWLYRRVVAEGVVRCATALRANQRELLAPVVAEMRQTEAEASDLARTAVPKLAAPLRLLASASAEAARVLQEKPAVADLTPPPDEPPVVVGSARSLLRVLVVQSLLVVREEDPVRRANHSTRVADVLAREILDRAETADAEEAGRLGQSLGAVLDRGVLGNLERVDPEDADAGQKKEAAEVRQRAGAAVARVKDKLPGMPVAARGGLQRAFQAQGSFQLHWSGKKYPNKLGPKDKGKSKPPPKKR